MPEERLTQLKGTEGRRGRALKAAARREGTHTHDRVDTCQSAGTGLTEITASGPITSWQRDGETMETVTDFISLDSKINADGDCSHEIKGHLLLGRKDRTNLDKAFKSRDITSLKKVRPVKAKAFPVVMYGCESWTKKKTEHGRTDALQLWCRRLESPARRSYQSVLKEICSEYSLEGLMLTLKLQYFSHWIRRADSLEKTLMLEKIEGRRRRE